MKISNTLMGLGGMIVVLAAMAAGAGVFWDDAGKPFSFTSVHGETVQINGRGLYRFDSVLIAAGFKIQDGYILAVGIPLLVFSIVLYRRGSWRGGLLLIGTLAYFFYNYVSMAFGAAHNNMLLAYILLMAASLFGLIYALTLFDLSMFPAHFSERLPRRGIAGFLIFIGVAFYLIWGGLDLIPTTLAGKLPATLGHYTTVITFAVDLGLVAPAMLIAGILLWRRAPAGYLLATGLLVFTLVLNLQLALMGVLQYRDGLMSIGQFIGMSVSFDMIALVALGFTFALWRNFSEQVGA